MMNSNFYNNLLKDNLAFEILDVSDYESVKENITKLVQYTKINVDEISGGTLGNSNLNNVIL